MHKTTSEKVRDRFEASDRLDTLRRDKWEQDRIAYNLNDRGGSIELSRGQDKHTIEWCG